MARMHTIGIRLDDDELATLDALAETERRKRSDLARLVLLDGLAERVRDRDEDARVAQPPEASPSHPFAPQPGNALKCETCGAKKGQHR